MEPSVQRFIDDMTELGVNPRVDAGLVIYQITPIDGVHAGVVVETGVSTEELSLWPQGFLHTGSIFRPASTSEEPTARRRRNPVG